MTGRYELNCLDCEFETTIGGEYPEARATAEAHRATVDAASDGHFVNIRHQN